MKKLLSLTAFLLSLISFAQVPQGISYQAIALNASGGPVVSSNVGIRLTILDNSATGTVLYTETQVKTTNAQGLYNLVIGQGTVVSGVFNTINWRVNSKFLKVEMDATGGTNYTLIGSTQLLSVPYALAADSLVTSAGEGITLVSPNGTPYQLSVSDSGQLSLPNSGSSSTAPSIIYTYGTFNSFNPTTALLMGSQSGVFYGYKYLTSGTQLKFLSQNNASSPIYGIDGAYMYLLNGNAYTVPSNGFYHLRIEPYGASSVVYQLSAQSIAPTLNNHNNNNSSYTTVNPTYNSTTNIFSYNLTGITNQNTFTFLIPTIFGQPLDYGDNLSDGTIEQPGTEILFPGSNTTPKNYRVDLTINFNGSGNYTITQLP